MLLFVYMSESLYLFVYLKVSFYTRICLSYVYINIAFSDSLIYIEYMDAV